MTVLFFSLVSQQAVEVMCFVPKRCNDMMTLGRLRGFEVQGWSNALLPQAEHSGDPYRELCSPGADRRWLVGSVRGRREEQRVAPFLLLFFSKATLLWFQGKLTAQGKLLGQDTFWVTEPEAGGLLSSRGRERRVFLFEQIIIFSEALGGGVRGGTQPGYVYKSSIKVGRVSQGRGLTGIGEASERTVAPQVLFGFVGGDRNQRGPEEFGGYLLFANPGELPGIGGEPPRRPLPLCTDLQRARGWDPALCPADCRPCGQSGLDQASGSDPGKPAGLPQW